MRALLLVADPDADSYTHELARRAESGLLAAGNEVTVVDLHAIGFAAAMSSVEREAYHGDEPVVSEQVAEQAALVTAADALVVVYPTIAGGLPAILKGWFERVLVPGVGFGFNAKGKVRPALTGIRHIVGVATYHEPRWKVAARNDNGRRTLTRAFRMSCGLQARSRWFGCHEPTSSTGRDEFADRVEREVTGLS